MSRGEREPSVPFPLLSPPPDGGTPPPWVRRPPARRQQLSLRVKQKHRLKVDAFTFGAADEARTRYLHLGKVALYQMSYSRIFSLFSRERDFLTRRWVTYRSDATSPGGIAFSAEKATLVEICHRHISKSQLSIPWLGGIIFSMSATALIEKMVPPGGIEPPTRGFSVPCSTD